MQRRDTILKTGTAALLSLLLAGAPQARAEAEVEKAAASPATNAPPEAVELLSTNAPARQVTEAGIGLGSSIEEVLAAYGDPTGIMGINGAHMFYYNEGEILIRDGEVARMKWKKKLFSGKEKVRIMQKPNHIVRKESGEVFTVEGQSGTTGIKSGTAGKGNTGKLLRIRSKLDAIQKTREQQLKEIDLLEDKGQP